MLFCVLTDHNGRLQLEPAKGQNGVSAPLPARRNLGTLRSSPTSTATAPAPAPAPALAGPTPQEVALQVHKRLLPDLRHNATAFEAMAVLLDYTTTKVRLKLEYPVPGHKRQQFFIFLKS